MLEQAWVGMMFRQAHFCNKLLSELGLTCVQRAPEPSQEEQFFDMCSAVFPNQELPPDGSDEEAVEEFRG